MKIAILIMATKQNPSTRNVDAFKNTVVKFCVENRYRLKHEYVFVFYYADDKTQTIKDDDFVYTFSYNMEESVYRTFEKTRCALIDVRDVINPDLYVRVNISTYINILLLDCLAEQMYKSDLLFCNRINNHVNIASSRFNDVYPRGDFMIFKKDVVDVIDREGEKYMYDNTNLKDLHIGVDHVDDCMIGVCLKDGIGKEYYEKISMLKYNYIPDAKPDYSSINMMCIASRLKTVPPNTNSGYSWDDNDFRLYDVEKFNDIHEIYKNVVYSDDVSLHSVLTKNEYQFIFAECTYLTKEQYTQIMNKRW